MPTRKSSSRSSPRKIQPGSPSSTSSYSEWVPTATPHPSSPATSSSPKAIDGSRTSKTRQSLPRSGSLSPTPLSTTHHALSSFAQERRRRTPSTRCWTSLRRAYLRLVSSPSSLASFTGSRTTLPRPRLSIPKPSSSSRSLLDSQCSGRLIEKTESESVQ